MAMGEEKTEKVGSTDDLVKWLKDRRITEVECMVSDMAGIARGKIIPTRKFVAGLNERSLKLPESIFGQTVTGDYIDSDFLGDIEPDIILDPDPATVRVVPWYDEPTAQIICDANYRDG
ncbi:MAG: glutamine synthetase, partial [Alphaproteobacteria bacterium HGW-Alphaproteobacteria-11]